MTMLAGFILESISFASITLYAVTRVALAVATLGLLARLFWGKAATQRDFLPLAAVSSALWWTLSGRGNLECEGKFVAASLAAFAIGTLCGFVFSSTTGESDSVGKVRDWLVGGVAALSVAQIASGGHAIRNVLEIFVAKGCPDDLAIVSGMVVVYSVGGFFLMFFNRELLLNILLARGRAQARQEFEKQGEAASAKIVQAFGQNPGLLDWQTTAQQEPLELDPDVREYVKEIEARLRQGESVPLNDVKKAAVVLALGGENIRATEFLKLAGQRNPQDEDIVLMLAKTLAELGERDQAVQQLLEFKKQNPRPSKVDKLLGFYLLWSPDKLEESARYTSTYLESTAPKDDGAIFNLACAYAQLYGQNKAESYRTKALQKLREAISSNVVWKERGLELTGPDGDFVSLKDDTEFQTIIQK